MGINEYVHGYSERESGRLVDQANALSTLLHHDTLFPAGSRVLEAGCGVGAQTIHLTGNNPHARIVSMDLAEASLKSARSSVRRQGFDSTAFLGGDIFRLPFAPASFDHVFVCFVLEHLIDPLGALECLKPVLKPGGTLTVIEGDHGSTCFHPEDPYARKAIQCLIDLQATGGGNSLIGRQLYPLLAAAGFKEIRVSPRMVYVDSSRPELVEGFTRNTFTAMVEGVRDQALDHGLIEPEEWEKGIAALYRTAAPDGTFCYTFFKGVAVA
jgi:ubiquinone/menaquinone biosynthesis C-methylase UbiE